MPKVKKPKNNKVLKIKPIPEEHEHPPVPHEVLPQHAFTLGLVAPKGGGKTTTCCNMLMFYAMYFHDIYIISPTIQADEKWKYMKKQRIVAFNKPFYTWVHDMLRQHKTDEIVPNTPSHELQGLASGLEGYTGYIDDDHFIEVGEHLDAAENAIRQIAEGQMMMVKLLEKYGQPIQMANRILVVLDDLVGSSLFARNGYFKGFNTRHRHYSISCIMMTQGYKEIPKTIRTNWTALMIYEIGNMKEKESIYEEYDMGYPKDTWLSAYNHCIEGDEDGHNFFYLNMKKPKRFRMMKNFEEYIIPHKESNVQELVQNTNKLTL